MKGILIFVILIFVSLAAILVGVVVGSITIHPLALTPTQKLIVFDFRLPRALEAYCIGSSLGLSGAVLQVILRNSLADGFTTGIAASSGFGAALSIAIGVNIFFVPIFALLSGLVGVFFILSLSSYSSNKTDLILAGIVLNIIATALIGFIKYFFEESIGSIVYWLMGGFYDVSFSKVVFIFTVLVVVLIVIIRFCVELDILSFDHTTALSMGVNVRFFRNLFFVLSSVLIAVSVSFSGIIPFVGLIVPHISRAFAHSNLKLYLIFSTLFGGSLLVLSDAAARGIMPMGEQLPVGILTSVLGGLFFLFVMFRNRGNAKVEY